jgi:carbonic anhydrase
MGNSLFILLILLLFTAASMAQTGHSEHSWDYGETNGPNSWGDLKPEFAPCKTGHRQSPIDIRNTQKADLPPISFDYKVVHLVHANQVGKLAVVAVLLQQGDDNPLIRELWKDLPKEKGREARLEDIHIEACRILPAHRGYYTFSGSRTTPPCSEDVTWFVLKEPTTVSAAEIEQFSLLYRNDARPTQPLYGRMVLESQ